MDKVSIQRTLDPGSKTSSVFKQYLAGLVCSLLTFINGICIGWSSSAIPQLEDGVLSSGPVSQENLGWVGGMLCLGALVISPLPGLLADKKGRKFAAYVIAMFSIINWSFMLAATDLWQVLVGRAFAGIACAGALTVVPIYNNEVAEPRVKASIGGLMIVTYSIGILCSYILGAWLSFHTVAAVYLCFTAAFLPAWWFMPESPAYLLLNGNEKEALRVLKWLMGPEESVAQDALQRLKTEQDGAVKPASIKQFFQDKAARKGLVLSYIIMTVQTFCGVFALQSYASSILSKAGGGISPTTGSIIYACVMVVGSLMPPLIADRLPRRVILGISLTFLAAGMATLGSFQYLQSQGINLSELGSLMGIVPIVVLSITVFFHFVGLGSVAYIAMMELFSDETRGVAGAFIAIAIWGTSFVLLQFFGMAVEAFGDYAVFFFFSSVSAFGLFFICAIFPETRGKSPSEMIAILSK